MPVAKEGKSPKGPCTHIVHIWALQLLYRNPLRPKYILYEYMDPFGRYLGASTMEVVLAGRMIAAACMHTTAKLVGVEHVHVAGDRGPGAICVSAAGKLEALNPEPFRV